MASQVWPWRRRYSLMATRLVCTPPCGGGYGPSCTTLIRLTRFSHNPSAEVAQGVPSGPVPAVSRLVSTLLAGVTLFRTKSVPMSGDAAGMSACATSYPRGRAQRHRRPIARRGQHGQAAQRGAGAIVDRDRWRTPVPDALRKIGHLRGVALVGPYPQTRLTRAFVHAHTLEIFGECAHALREYLHPLAARCLAAQRAIRQIAHRSIGETERRHQVVLPDRVGLP